MLDTTIQKKKNKPKKKKTTTILTISKSSANSKSIIWQNKVKLSPNSYPRVCELNVLINHDILKKQLRKYYQGQWDINNIV